MRPAGIVTIVTTSRAVVNSSLFQFHRSSRIYYYLQLYRPPSCDISSSSRGSLSRRGFILLSEFQFIPACQHRIIPLFATTNSKFSSSTKSSTSISDYFKILGVDVSSIFFKAVASFLFFF